MILSELTKDIDKVKQNLVKLEDKSMVTKGELKIYYPTRWLERGLAITGIDDIVLFCLLLVVDDKYYATINVNAKVRLEPYRVETVLINGDAYQELYFPKGSTVTKSLSLIKQDTLTYYIYDEFMSKGRIPFYLDYSIAGKLFDTAKKHAGANIGSDFEVTELIISLQARSLHDRTIYFRQSIKSMEDINKHLYVWTSLKNVRDSATNTTTRLGGSYYSEGVVSALINPSERVEQVESILMA